MNIWLVQTGETLPLEDGTRRMRTQWLAEELVERGHSVIWWASAFEHQRKKWLFKEDVDVKLSDKYLIKVLKGISYRKNKSVRRYVDHRILASKFAKSAPSLMNPDIVVASTPPYDIAYEAIGFAKERNIPTIVDIRDPWPDTFWEGRSPLIKAVIKGVLHRDIGMVRSLMRDADSLVAVSQGFLDWGLAYAGRCSRASDKVFYLGYGRRKGTGVDIALSADVMERFRDKKIFFFAGTMGSSYELDLIVRAADILSQRDITDIHFVLAGVGEQYDDLRDKTSDMQNVTMTGWLGADEIGYLLKKSYAGLVPCRSVRNCVPNKPFEYISVGLPLISSLEGEMEEIINRHGIGINYPAGDLERFIGAMLQLTRDEEMRRSCSNRALDVFMKRFDARAITEAYADHVENMAALQSRS